MTGNYFINMIISLRQQEEIILYGNIMQVNEGEIAETITFLQKEYAQEALGYPHKAPPFDPLAAAWAAKTIYIAAQLILYRENKSPELAPLLPDFTAAVTPSALLSADLCLRFLPNMLTQLKIIDSEDPLITLLEKRLQQWHYSGINYPLEVAALDFTGISADRCTMQLYVNRIIDYKKISLAKHPACSQLVIAGMGIFAQEFWNNLKLELTIDGND